MTGLPTTQPPAATEGDGFKATAVKYLENVIRVCQKALDEIRRGDRQDGKAQDK